MSDFNQDELRKLLKEYSKGSSNDEPKDEAPKKAIVGEDDIHYAEEKANEELEKVHDAWEQFQEEISGLAITSIMDKLEQAYRDGEISESDKALYLLYSIFDREMLSEKYRGLVPEKSGTGALEEVSSAKNPKILHYNHYCNCFL
jgi:hypothetical protein